MYIYINLKAPIRWNVHADVIDKLNFIFFLIKLLWIKTLEKVEKWRGATLPQFAQWTYNLSTDAFFEKFWNGTISFLSVEFYFHQLFTNPVFNGCGWWHYSLPYYALRHRSLFLNVFPHFKIHELRKLGLFLSRMKSHKRVMVRITFVRHAL